MAKPIITFELSDDENSVFVYDGDHDLVACIGLQRSDAEYQLKQHLDSVLFPLYQTTQVL